MFGFRGRDMVAHSGEVRFRAPRGSVMRHIHHEWTRGEFNRDAYNPKPAPPPSSPPARLPCRLDVLTTKSVSPPRTLPFAVHPTSKTLTHSQPPPPRVITPDIHDLVVHELLEVRDTEVPPAQSGNSHCEVVFTAELSNLLESA
jgi:hypothetical protein